MQKYCICLILTLLVVVIANCDEWNNYDASVYCDKYIDRSAIKQRLKHVSTNIKIFNAILANNTMNPRGKQQLQYTLEQHKNEMNALKICPQYKM